MQKRPMLAAAFALFLAVSAGCVTSDILSEPRPVLPADEVVEHGASSGSEAGAENVAADESKPAKEKGFWKQPFGTPSGISAEARAIERRLGL